MRGELKLFSRAGKVALLGVASAIAMTVVSAAHGASLKEAVAQAIATNPALRAIGDNRAAIGHEVRRAQGEFLPQLDVFVGQGFQRYSSPTTRASGTDDDFLDREEYSAILTQRIFDGFATSSEVQRQRARVRSAAHRVFENAEVLALDAALAYLEVFRQRNLLELSRENVTIHEGILASLKERQEAGGGSVSDVAQTEARLARSKATLLTTENELRNAEAGYRRIVGDAPEDLSIPDFDYTILPNDEEQAVQMAEKNNPTVRIFDADVDTAARQIDVADAAFYPQVKLEASYSYSDDADGVESWNEDVQLMLRVQWNLYRGGTDKANRRVAIARRTQARSQRWAASIEAVEEMRRSWSAYTIESEKPMPWAPPSISVNRPAISTSSSSMSRNAPCSTCWTPRTNCSSPAVRKSPPTSTGRRRATASLPRSAACSATSVYLPRRRAVSRPKASAKACSTKLSRRPIVTEKPA